MFKVSEMELPRLEGIRSIVVRHYSPDEKISGSSLQDNWKKLREKYSDLRFHIFPLYDSNGPNGTEFSFEGPYQGQNMKDALKNMIIHEIMDHIRKSIYIKRKD